VSAELPSGTVTFLFTDVEGSTKLLHELGSEGYADALAEHRRIIREATAARHGVEVDTQGDGLPEVLQLSLSRWMRCANRQAEEEEASRPLPLPIRASAPS
jgi:class 3 adenylate cyclase